MNNWVISYVHQEQVDLIDGWTYFVDLPSEDHERFTLAGALEVIADFQREDAKDGEKFLYRLENVDTKQKIIL